MVFVFPCVLAEICFACQANQFAETWGILSETISSGSFFQLRIALLFAELLLSSWDDLNCSLKLNFLFNSHGCSGVTGASNGFYTRSWGCQHLSEVFAAGRWHIDEEVYAGFQYISRQIVQDVEHSVLFCSVLWEPKRGQNNMGVSWMWWFWIPEQLFVRMGRFRGLQ